MTTRISNSSLANALPWVPTKTGESIVHASQNASIQSELKSAKIKKILAITLTVVLALSLVASFIVLPALLGSWGKLISWALIGATIVSAAKSQLLKYAYKEKTKELARKVEANDLNQNIKKEDLADLQAAHTLLNKKIELEEQDPSSILTWAQAGTFYAQKKAQALTRYELTEELTQRSAEQEKEDPNLHKIVELGKLLRQSVEKVVPNQKSDASVEQEVEVSSSSATEIPEVTQLKSKVKQFINKVPAGIGKECLLRMSVRSLLKVSALIQPVSA